jgi:hypothetical protein
MSLSFGIGDIIAAVSLCAKIYDRCKQSRGEFQGLSAEADGLRGVLTIIQNIFPTLTEEHRAGLKAIADPLLSSLPELAARLHRCRSLGTEAPGIGDQIRWAWDGGAKKLRENLDSHLTLLNVFYTRYATLLPQRNCDDLTYP